MVWIDLEGKSQDAKYSPKFLRLKSAVMDALKKEN
jgi:hypothetical protein